MEAQLRPAERIDVPAIQRIAVETRMFDEGAVGFFEDLVSAFVIGEAGEDRWTVATRDGTVVGAAYVAPESFGDRVWNLLFISVDPAEQGRGTGALLIGDVERWLRERGEEVARVLIVETSSTDQYRGARAFYLRRDFTEEARIREYYGPGDDKVVFWRSLVG
jgi:ribosomal protein S18 acetylase RimI-like enzyme